MTTIERWRRRRARHQVDVLLIRCGDFYGAFGPDAELLASKCGTTVTYRDRTFPMTGFPAARLPEYVSKCNAAGLSTAVIEGCDV